MKHLYKILSVLFFWGISTVGISSVRIPEGAVTDTLVMFRFHPGKDMFILEGNEAELERLYVLIDTCKAEIAKGNIPVQVDGYCASLPTAKENLHTAFIRANRVKSELITRKGLKETDFVTTNYARAYHNNKDVVVVTLRVPAKTVVESRPAKEEVKREDPAPQEVTVKKKEEPVAEKQPEANGNVERQPAPAPVAERLSPEPEQLYRFAVRTNVLYDAFLLPTLGVEWRVNRDLGVKLDGSLAWWSGGSNGKVQKMWMLSPEVRRYLLDSKRFYVGLSGSYGEYNIYKYMLGGVLSKDTGYQGKCWNVGLTLGYQLYLSRAFSVDFNLGLGYTRSEYDSYGVTDGVRVYKERNNSKHFWGPTRAGISLVWTIGSK